MQSSILQELKNCCEDYVITIVYHVPVPTVEIQSCDALKFRDFCLKKCMLAINIKLTRPCAKPSIFECVEIAITKFEKKNKNIYSVLKDSPSLPPQNFIFTNLIFLHVEQSTVFLVSEALRPNKGRKQQRYQQCVHAVHCLN